MLATAVNTHFPATVDHLLERYSERSTVAERMNVEHQIGEHLGRAILLNRDAAGSILASVKEKAPTLLEIARQSPASQLKIFDPDKEGVGNRLPAEYELGHTVESRVATMSSFSRMNIWLQVLKVLMSNGNDFKTYKDEFMRHMHIELSKPQNAYKDGEHMPSTDDIANILEEKIHEVTSRANELL